MTSKAGFCHKRVQKKKNSRQYSFLNIFLSRDGVVFEFPARDDVFLISNKIADPPFETTCHDMPILQKNPTSFDRTFSTKRL